MTDIIQTEMIQTETAPTETVRAGALSASGFDISPPGKVERARLEAGLTRAEKDVLLHHGTEAPFCGGLLDNKADGVYCCRLCGLPLFQARTKFESGTGWPSFFAPIDEAHVRAVRDTSYGMVRVETPLRPLRQPPGSRLSRWPTAKPATLLHQLRFASVRGQRRAPARSAGEGRPLGVSADRDASR